MGMLIPDLIYSKKPMIIKTQPAERMNSACMAIGAVEGFYDFSF